MFVLFFRSFFHDAVRLEGQIGRRREDQHSDGTKPEHITEAEAKFPRGRTRRSNCFQICLISYKNKSREISISICKNIYFCRVTVIALTFRSDRNATK